MIRLSKHAHERYCERVANVRFQWLEKHVNEINPPSLNLMRRIRAKSPGIAAKVKVGESELLADHRALYAVTFNRDGPTVTTVFPRAMFFKRNAMRNMARIMELERAKDADDRT